jgi:hypothetical protein
MFRLSDADGGLFCRAAIAAKLIISPVAIDLRRCDRCFSRFNFSFLAASCNLLFNRDVAFVDKKFDRPVACCLNRSIFLLCRMFLDCRCLPFLIFPNNDCTICGFNFVGLFLRQFLGGWTRPVFTMPFNLPHNLFLPLPWRIDCFLLALMKDNALPTGGRWLGAFSSLLGVAFFLNSPNMTTSRGRVLVAFVELDRPCESCAVMVHLACPRGDSSFVNFETTKSIVKKWPTPQRQTFPNIQGLSLLPPYCSLFLHRMASTRLQY